MKLEQALTLKAGTRIRATSSWMAPGTCTKNNTYTLETDVIPLWYHPEPTWGSMITEESQSHAPCNAKFHIVDDDNKSAKVYHHSFEVVRQAS